MGMTISRAVVYLRYSGGWRDRWIEQVVYPGNNPHQEERHTGDQLRAREHQQAPCLVAIAVEKSDRDGEKDNRSQEQHIQDDEEAAGALQIGKDAVVGDPGTGDHEIGGKIKR